MSKYIIWDKEQDIITPVGEVLTPEEWKNRYPISAIPGIDIVCGGGVVNGNIFAVYNDFKQMYEKNGCDFSACKTKQECLDAIEAFEDALANLEPEVTAEERIAAALEYQNMASMEDVEVIE